MESCLQAWVRNSCSDTKDVISWKHILQFLYTKWWLKISLSLLSPSKMPPQSFTPYNTPLSGLPTQPHCIWTIPISTFPLLSPQKSSRFYSPWNAGEQAQGILSLMQRAVLADRFIDYRLWENKISQLSTTRGYQGTWTLQNGHSQPSLLIHKPSATPLPRSFPAPWIHPLSYPKSCFALSPVSHLHCFWNRIIRCANTLYY